MAELTKTRAQRPNDVGIGGVLPRLLPLVGRTRELALLEALMEEGDDASRVVFVHGEGGVGKSRVVAERAARAERRSWEVVRGRAYPVETGVPYAVFSDAWLPLLTSMDPSRLTVLTRGGDADLRYLFPALGQPDEEGFRVASGEPEEFRTRIMWNFAEFVKRYAGRTPLLCVLEDLQWADASSLELLHFLARQVTGAPILIACTYNDQERDRRRALVRTERSLEAIGAAHVMKLEPLTRDHVGELVSRSFETDGECTAGRGATRSSWRRS
jgi:predicted ATPase